MDTLSALLSYRIVVILRGAHPQDVAPIAEALHAGGVRAIEVTLNSSEAFAGIRDLALRLGDKMLVGAGTVLGARAAQEAIDAGARFIISPHLDTRIIRAAKASGVVSIPGAYTPTEILEAYTEGGDLVKLFPASGGPDYIRHIRGPFPHIPLMPAGGINLSNIRDFFDAGAKVVGIGSALVKAGRRVTEDDLWAMTDKARLYAEAALAEC